MDIRQQLLVGRLKTIKSALPKKCTFLALVNRKGEYYISAKVNKEDYHIDIEDQTFDFTNEDYERIFDQLSTVCQITN